jgi:type IV secretion system protein TrbG
MRRLTLNLLVLAASATALTPASADPPEPASAPTSPAPAQAPAPRPIPHHRVRVHRAPPIADVARVAAANAAARVQPEGAGYQGAIQVFDWSDGALYEVYAAPGEVTDIVLQPGEALAGTGPVAAGDTVRWVIGDTDSGAGTAKAVHILLKPTRADLRTNLVINTDRRTYHLELRATPATYMASVSWRYPQDQLVAIHQAEPPDPSLGRLATAGLDLDHLDFRYRIKGPHPSWRPVQVFDDGRQTFIAFPAGVAQGDMPPLFVIGADGKSAELVNYRVQGRHMVVDRLFHVAELRLGDKHSAVRIRLEKAG